MSEEEKQSESGREAFAAGVRQMKLATRQYSRRQAKWMRNRSPQNRAFYRVTLVVWHFFLLISFERSAVCPIRFGLL